ncbi:BT_3987 domain-containing protein [Sphingobacterium humi]|uniref:DUF1735 domain-containing protein n=1 Tax=Sphingobacterium humi TaxID=1796905 RepID=A0A6N8KUL2_9SPHI|nr:DUF1735 domain-containing protein [Sphingobacterium humi]MVZ60797.1 DUF1735 domain-containing protein [Sphingobacterium humi]
MKNTYNKLFRNSLRYSTLLMVCAPILLFQQCKQQELNVENEDQYTKIFMQSASNGSVAKSLAIKDEWVNIPFGAGYGGFTILNNPVTVNFEIDQAKVDAYNQQNNSSYELPPADSYKISSSSVTIAPGNAGSNNSNLEINPLKLAGTKTYIIPVSITDVQPALSINENLRTTYYLVNGFYESNPFEPISIEGWEIHDYSDDDSDGAGGRAKYAIDGTIEKIWLSTYRRVNGWRPPHPHYVTIDMNATHQLHGITLFGRRGQNNAYLFPKNVLIETSNDGNTWTEAGLFSIVASSDDTSATMYFEKSANCRYFKVTVLSSAGNGDTTSIAELVAF